MSGNCLNTIQMPRPVRNRRLDNPPQMAGFKPFGMPLCEAKSIKLQFDEYESIKLVNYENLSQDEAAVKMGVSRPTLTRIHNSALKKIARAFVECASIEIEGGKVEFEKQWYKCKKCFKLIDGLENHKKCKNCNYYNDNELIMLNQSNK
jgi:predicted DNA-binding protein (UPF0251 family)